VQVVRLGEPSTIVDDAELFLLTDPRTLVTLWIREVVDKMIWMKPDLLIVRLRNQREAQYRETVMCELDGSFLRYQRSYGGWDSRLARLGVYARSGSGTIWQNSQSAQQPPAVQEAVATGDRRRCRCRGRRMTGASRTRRHSLCAIW